MINTFFFIGHKHSGTSVTANCIGQHPNVYVGGEMDIIWFLYQTSIGAEITKHDLDGQAGLDLFLKQHETAIAELNNGPINDDTLRDFFCQQMSKKGKATFMAGDKKPVQAATDELYDFTLRLFPDTKFIHLLRHPRCVCEIPSHMPSKDFDVWVKVEEFICEKKQTDPDRFFTFRYEDFVLSPNETMIRIFTFLGLTIPKNDYSKIIHTDNKNLKYKERPVPPFILEWLEKYGYEKDGVGVIKGVGLC